MEPAELGGRIGILIKDIALILLGLYFGWKAINYKKKPKKIEE